MYNVSVCMCGFLLSGVANCVCVRGFLLSGIDNILYIYINGIVHDIVHACFFGCLVQQ